MSIPADRAPTKRSDAAGAGAAGAGSGTLLVLIANNLPADNPARQWLLIAAPTVSIFFSGLWLWANVKLRNWLRYREIQSILKTAKQTLEAALQNEYTTQTHRNKLKKELEKLEILAIGHQMKRIKSIEVVTESDVLQAQQQST